MKMMLCAAMVMYMTVGDIVREPGYLFHIHDSKGCHNEVYMKDGLSAAALKFGQLMADPLFSYLEVSFEPDLEYRVIAEGSG